MAQGLLGGVLPAIYSGADQLKRQIYGLLTNPQEIANRASQSLLQSHNERQALMAQAFGNPNNPTQVTNPQALNALTQQVMAGELGFAPAGITAWHGSPHTFEKFDMSKVGTGEGAQAYGHGMYFAEAPDVAKSYSTVGGKGEFVRLGDKVVPTASQEGQLLSDVTKLGRKAAINKYPNQADYIKTINPDNIKFEGGNLYKVDIPDEHIPMMLDWDKSLSQQSKTVQEALAKIDPDLYSPKSMNYDPAERGQWIYMRLANDTTQKNAANKLNEFGIKGIRYLDQGSRGKGGTSNFVVFDPTDVKILERNDKPIEGLLD